MYLYYPNSIMHSISLESAYLENILENNITNYVSS